MERIYRPFAVDRAVWAPDSCRAAAMLAISPEIMSGWFGVDFEQAADARPAYRAAGLELPSGRRVVLRWDDEAPEPRGLRLLADLRDDAAAACDETILVLGLSPRDVMWRGNGPQPSSSTAP